jgi:hypothetical protein
MNAPPNPPAQGQSSAAQPGTTTSAESGHHDAPVVQVTAPSAEDNPSAQGSASTTNNPEHQAGAEVEMTEVAEAQQQLPQATGDNASAQHGTSATETPDQSTAAQAEGNAPPAGPGPQTTASDHAEVASVTASMATSMRTAPTLQIDVRYTIFVILSFSAVRLSST